MAKFSSVNTLPATGPVAMYSSVLTTMVNAGWVVIRSGDGLALYSSTGNILTTGAAGVGGLGQANAYFEIRDASTKVALSFQMITTTTWRVKYTELGIFSGGTPSATRVGSATDEQVFYGAGTDAAPTGTQMLHTDNSYRFHCVANSTAQTGSGTFPVWFGCTVNTTGIQASFFGLDGMANGTYHTLDQAPRVIITWYVSGGPVTGGWSGITDTGFYARAWVAYGLGGATFRRFAIPSYNFGNTAGTVTLGLGGASTLDTSPYAADDQPLPLLIGRMVTHGAQSGPKGYCADFKFSTHNTRGYPSTILNATNAYVYYGGMLLSWPESVSPSF